MHCVQVANADNKSPCLIQLQHHVSNTCFKLTTASALMHCYGLQVTMLQAFAARDLADLTSESCVVHT